MDSRTRPLVVALLFMASGMARAADEPPGSAAKPAGAAAQASASLDRSGKTRQGQASYYGPALYGKEMANGAAMNPRSDVAASKTLPIGTKAKVTKLETGKSAEVVIEDRGPYKKGRIIDLSPKTAGKLDMKDGGVAPVKVQPLALPPKGTDARPDKATDKTPSKAPPNG